MVRSVPEKMAEYEDSKPEEISKNRKEDSKKEEIEVECLSSYYKTGDLVHFIDEKNGSWRDGVIENIMRKVSEEVIEDYADEEDLIFKIRVDGWVYLSFLKLSFTRNLNRDTAQELLSLKFKEIRPNPNVTLSKKELNVGDVVLVNYNIENPKAGGHWYDFKVENLDDGVTGSLLVGCEKTAVKNCTIEPDTEIKKIRNPEQNEGEDKSGALSDGNIFF